MFHGIFSWTISQFSRGTGASAEAAGQERRRKTKLNVGSFYVPSMESHRYTDDVLARTCFGSASGEFAQPLLQMSIRLDYIFTTFGEKSL